VLKRPLLLLRLLHSFRNEKQHVCCSSNQCCWLLLVLLLLLLPLCCLLGTSSQGWLYAASTHSREL
jgi:hypothetical protein